MRRVGFNWRPSRFALLASAAALASALSSLASAEGLTPSQQLAHDVYKELIEINTVTATGDTAKAAEAMAARLRAAGFGDDEVRVFSPAPHKGDLVARLRGTGARKPICCLRISTWYRPTARTGRSIRSS